MAEEVTDQDGREWTVRRRWVPRLPGETLWGRFRRRFVRHSRRMSNLDGAQLLPSGGGDGIGGVIAAIGLIIALIVFLVIVVPIVFALVEILVLVVLALLTVAARIVLRRPWTVEASAEDGELLTWRVVGWRASGEQVQTVAGDLRRGARPIGATESQWPDRPT